MCDEIDVHEGFYEAHTGGGCMAWMRDLPTAQECKVEIIITESDGVSMPDKKTEYVLVGFTLMAEGMEFEDDKPPIINQLFELTDDEHDLFNVNGNYFCYGISLKNASLEKITDIVRSLTLDTFNSKVVLGLNNPTGDETR